MTVGLFLLFWCPLTPSCQSLFNIKDMKKVKSWSDLPCRSSSRVALLNQAWSLANPCPCSESMLRKKHDRGDKCENILLLICIFPQQSVIWRLSEQDEVVPAFVLNNSWWAYGLWIGLILSGTHFYFCSLQHDSTEFRVSGSFLTIAFSFQLHQFSMPVSAVTAPAGEPNVPSESQHDSLGTSQGHFWTCLGISKGNGKSRFSDGAIRGLKPQTSHFWYACFNPCLLHRRRELLLSS